MTTHSSFDLPVFSLKPVEFQIPSIFSVRECLPDGTRVAFHGWANRTSIKERSNMSRSFSRIGHSSGNFNGPSSQENDTPFTDPNQRLRRLASLVAIGDAPMPTELEPSELSFVLGEVARLRRDRLITFLALAIARDIHRERELEPRSTR